MEEVVIQKLLDMGMSPAYLNCLDLNAAHMVAGFCDNVQLLMLLPLEMLTHTSAVGFTPLHIAVRDKRVQVVQWMLEQPCCPVDARNMHGHTAEQYSFGRSGPAAEAIRAAFAAHRRWTALRAAWVAAAAAAAASARFL